MRLDCLSWRAEGAEVQLAACSVQLGEVEDVPDGGTRGGHGAL